MSNMSELQIIDALVVSGRYGEAVEQLTGMIDSDPENAVLWFSRGKLLWRMGKHSAAMNDYAHAAELDPSSPAVHALEQAREIAGFFNPDLYNP